MQTDVRTDEQLVVAAKRGSRDDFAALYDRYVDPIYDYLVRLTRSRELAADIAQDTFIRAMQKIDQLDQPGAFKGWIYRIARSQALNQLEREGRSVAMAPMDGETEGLNPLLSQIDPDRLTSPAVVAEIEGDRIPRLGGGRRTRRTHVHGAGPDGASRPRLGRDRRSHGGHGRQRLHDGQPYEGPSRGGHRSLRHGT